MARVTVEDCIERIPNRFDLVMVAGQRAREISAGEAPITVERDNDKNPVIALREIADETVEIASLQESLIGGVSRNMSSSTFLKRKKSSSCSNPKPRRWCCSDAPLADGEEGSEDGMPQMRFEDAVDESPDN